MAFDEKLADRVRDLLAGEPALIEKRMFGGLALMLDGNMAVGVMADELLVRLGPVTMDDALAEEGTRPFMMGERVGKGWVLVAPAAVADAAALRRWVARGVAVARSLPPK